jgi:hypothetical protein
MNAPIRSRNLKQPRAQRQHFRPIGERYAYYEQLKSQLTANATTSAEYDEGVKEAARRAGV